MTTFEAFKALEIPLAHTQSPRPDKVHIGLVQLSTDHSLEADLAKLTGDAALVFSSRVFYSSVMTRAALNDIATGITRAADLIATGLPMDVMVFGCTSASMVIGSQKIAELLTANRPGIPATNPWAAAKAAFRHLNAKKISVFSPYPTDVNYPLFRELLAEGFEVPAIGALGIQNDTDITRVSCDSMADGAQRLLDRAETDLIFMSCTNLRVLDHIEKLEALLGVPVVCSNQAMYWHAVTLAGKQPDCKGFGRLLSP
ncbi:MAG: aspartate/glutamate racemase family protein [Desulfobacter sp.]